MGDLERAVQNASGLWTALAEARGLEPVRRPGFLAVEGDWRGRRLMVLSPSPAPEEVAELTRLATRPSAGGVTLEDSFGSLDMTEHPLKKRQLAVMVRHPSPLPALQQPGVTVAKVERADLLPLMERIAVDAFPLDTFQPYRQGEAFPPALFEREEVTFFIAEREGVPVGITMTVLAGGVAGIYWVTTLPEHRSRGVARAMMHHVLEHHADLPVTLTSATAARALYESLGFTTLTMANWWSGDALGGNP